MVRGKEKRARSVWRCQACGHAKFFDTIEPVHLRTILQQRIND